MVKMFSDIEMNKTLPLLDAVSKVIQRNWYILGEEVNRFEEEFAAYIGSQYCTTLANGTDALELALKALNVGPGDTVATVANAGFYSSTAIYKVGATPLYVDICSDSMTMDVADLEYALTLKPKCIIVTHLYGQLADMEKIKILADAAGIPIIEDCAQSHGATSNGRQAGSWGAIACFSFYPTKNLGALGDGGAIVTSDKVLNDTVRTLRQYGWTSKYDVSHERGCNSRLDEMQAAILRVKLPHLDAWNEDRRRIASIYNAELGELPQLTLPTVSKEYVGHLYVIRLQGRDDLKDFLRQHDIACDVHYPIPDHLQKAYRGQGHSKNLAVTERVCQEILTLPCYPLMSEDDVAKVVKTIKLFFAR